MSDQNSTITQRPSFMRRYRLPLMIGAPVIVLVVAGWLWITGGRYVSTDDSFVQRGRVPISCNVAGRVAVVAVHENQRVKKGDMLFKLEGGAQKLFYDQRKNELDAAQQTLSYRQRELARNRGLASSGVISREELDAAAHDVEVASQQVSTAKGQLAQAAANLATGGGADNPTIGQARAARDRAMVTLVETAVYAPQDGVVTKVSQLQVGAQIAAGTPLFSLMTDDLWVDSNFKESDLAHMRPGQKATVKVDAHPGQEFEAKVESISPGTGAAFSLLPPENATGNWVKVTQRVPVRLVFTKRPAINLQSGLSAVVKVDTEYRRLGGSASAR
jgi:membrane fusion protein (multidrug efflux system)